MGFEAMSPGPSEGQLPSCASKAKDEKGALAPRSLSWTGAAHSLSSSFDGCEFDARSASVLPRQSFDATSLRLHEASLFSSDSKFSTGANTGEIPASLESSSSGLFVRSVRAANSFVPSYAYASTSGPNSTGPVSAPTSLDSSISLHRAGNPASCRTSECGDASQATHAKHPGSLLPQSTGSVSAPGSAPGSAPSSPYACKSLPSSTSTLVAVDVPESECGGDEEKWLAHPETQSAVLEMLEEEVATAIIPNYMDFHSDAVMPEGLSITPAMRLMTINWMSEAIYDLDLDQRVVAMSVNLLDRYLSASRGFPRSMLQLAAAAAIFIASKIEGVLPHPRASRVAALSDGAFDLERLIGFERVMCHSLGFDLYGPTTQNFLDMWLYALPPAVGEGEKFFFDKVHKLASYLLELGSLVYDTLRHKRSLLATSALLLALGDPGLQKGVAAALGVRPEDIKQHAEGIVATLRHYISPDGGVVDVTVATAELLRLHRLAKAPENREQFVIVKFGSAKCGYIAEMAKPMASAEEFHRFMRVYFGTAT